MARGVALFFVLWHGIGSASWPAKHGVSRQWIFIVVVLMRLQPQLLIEWSLGLR